MYQNAVIANDLFQHTVLLSLEILDLWARVNLIESFRKDDGRTRGRHSSTKIDLRMPNPSHLSVLGKIFDRIWLKRAFAKTTDTLEKVILYENRSAHARPPHLFVLDEFLSTEFV